MAKRATLWRFCAALLLLTWAACIVTEGSEAEHEEQAVPALWASSAHREGSEGLRTQGEVDGVMTSHDAPGEVFLEEGAGLLEDPEAPKLPAAKPKDMAKEYFRIPHLRFEYKSHSVPETPLTECKILCTDKEKECQSFSFNEKTEECLWSEETFRFNPRWTYYSKRFKGFYQPTPGLKYQSSLGGKS